VKIFFAGLASLVFGLLSMLVFVYYPIYWVYSKISSVGR